MRSLIVPGLICLMLAGAGCKKPKHGWGSRGGADDEKTVVAKLIVQPGTRASVNWNGNLEDFYDHQVAALDDAKLKEVAQDKAAASANGAVRPVTIVVARVRGSEILTLRARADSVEYAKVYAEALIDAYVRKEQGVLSETKVDEAARVANEAIPPLEAKLKQAENAVTVYKLENDIPRFTKDLDAERRHLKRLSSAERYYASELDFMKRSTLDTEVTRRKYPPLPPGDMPDEFARVLSLQLTPNEQAYLNAMTKADSAATAATRPQAEKDRQARKESFTHQFEAVKVLIKDGQARASELEAKLAISGQLENDLAKARTEYELQHTKATGAEKSSEAKPDAPQVIITVVEKPQAVNTQP